MRSDVKRLLISLASALALTACQGDAEKIAEHLSRGETYEEEGDYSAAIIEYKNVLQIDPNTAAAHWGLAKAFVAVQQIREAFWELREVVRLDPTNDEARTQLGQMLLAARDFEEALIHGDELIARGEELTMGYALRGQALQALKRSDEAIEAFRMAVENAGDETGPRHLLIHALTLSGDRQSAEAQLDDLIELDPGFVSYSVYGGFLRTDPEREDEAEAAFLEAVKRAEGDEVIRAYRNAANFYIEQRRFDEADTFLEGAIASVDEPMDLIYLLARLHVAQGNEEKVEGLIRKATAVNSDDPMPYLTLSGYLGRKGDIEGSLQAAEQALTIDPNLVQAKLRVAEIMVDIGYRESDDEKTARGHEMVTEVLAGAPSDPSALMVMAKIDLAENRVDEAIVRLRAAIAVAPDNAQAHFILGTALSIKGERSVARTELARALELDPAMHEARRILARVHSQLGEHEYAVEEGRRYLKKSKTDSVDTRILVAQNLVILRRLDDALAQLTEIPEDQMTVEARYALGRVYLQLRDPEKGRLFMTEALEGLPHHTDILTNLMRLDYRDGRLDESIKRIQIAVEAEPDNAGLQTLLGQVALLDRRPADAEASFKKAIEINPDEASGYEKLAQLFAQTGRLDEAVKTYESAIEARPDDPNLHLLLALLYQFGGAEERAIDRYEDAIKYGPNLASAKNNLAYIFAESGEQLDRALDLAQDAKAAQPDSAVIADTLGWVLYKRGIPSAAISYLKEAEANSRGDLGLSGIVRHHLAQAYEADGDVAEAREALERAIGGLEALAQQATAGGNEVVEPDWAVNARSMLARLESGG